MAPRGKQTGVEARQIILKLHFDGKTVREIAELVGRSKSTVHDIIKRFREDGRLINKSQEGKRKRLNSREERSIIREIKVDPFKTAKELRMSIKTNFGKDVCDNTVRNTLHRYDLHGRVAQKKPYISPKNKAFRVKFAKEYLLKTDDFWNHVSWLYIILNTFLFLLIILFKGVIY